ncbi:hypothetical protein Dsin_000041 [Dipteronia sinensis]|uniref:MBD domain-containing protein n=1 Tax=Dipteronia sinensis TaxID=43782 RepID=A0AAE0DJF9_9ROSI|nr:hypothetical protein Dsin_000041 [Dipteronia sinensis]
MVSHNNDINSSSFDIGFSTPMYLDVVSDPDLADIRVALLEPIFEPLDPIFQQPPPPPPPPTTTQQELLPQPPSQEDLPPEVHQQQDELPPPQQELPPPPPAWLPAGWSIEKKTRMNGASAGNTDKYYLSPEGRKFRSRNAVEAYLSGQDTKVCKRRRLMGEEKLQYQNEGKRERERRIGNVP